MRRRLIVLGLVAGALAWPLAWAVESWRFRVELGRAERDVASGRFGPAGARLARLAARWPGQGEPAYWLGICEAAEGRVDAALAAWARVPPRSGVAPDAALRRGRLALEHGRFAEAEESLAFALCAPNGQAHEARQALGQLYWLSGRSDDFRRLLRADWERSSDPAGILRELWMLDTVAHPIDAIQDALAKAGRAAPDDDRVWLGRADLATRAGRFAEADDWLTRCAARRPHDPAVGAARLAWARAAGRVDEAEAALARVPADGLSPARILDLRAWFAARRGDDPAERAALSELIVLDPGDSAALDRLTELIARSGSPDDAARLRHRKAALDRTKERYRQLLTEADAVAHATELAGLAEALGRWFEARGWWTLRARRDRDDPEARAALARLGREPRSLPSSGRTLADLLADVLPSRRSSRPILDRTTLPAFVDAAETVGLRFHFDSGASALHQLPETMSGGVGLLDYDGDGWLDVYALQGGAFPPDPGASTGDRLYHNRGDGTFADVTDRSGLARMSGGYSHGVAVGDYDNDGFPDLFVTRWRSYALYHNQGDGTFVDVTAAVGLGGDRDWPTSAAWADLDGDGDLDLYVCHYLDWDARRPKTCAHPEARAHTSTYCDPRDFAALPDHVFRNTGGRFEDVTGAAGIVDREGRGLGVIAADLDGDGRIDLFVANDTTANYLFRNLGGFRFREEGTESGLAANASGGYLAGMGVACGDLDGDGRIDLAVTNFFGESTTFYHALGDGQYSDHTAAVGLAAPSRFLLGFGIAIFDADNDGLLDLATANGHVNDYRPSVPYAMPAQLLMGTAEGRLVDVTDRAGPPWRVPRLGRGLAVGDLDNDGRLDLVIVGRDAPLALFQNRTSGGRFVTLRLEGTASNRDAVGARVTLTAGGRRQVAQRCGGGSYLSASDGRLHFGLGAVRRVDQIEVAWPSGRVDLYRDLAADSGYHLREGDPEPRPLRDRIRD